MKQLTFKSASAISDIDDEQGIVKGLGSVFGNVDSDGDVIEKGAYSKTIQENKGRIKYLYQHRLDKPVGSMKELNETNEGLEFVAQIATKTTLGRDVFEMIKAGVVTENSVGFSTVKQQFDNEKKINYIKEVKLWEISAVTLAANPLAIISGAKGEGIELAKQFLEERFEALSRLLKSNISDELGHAVEFEIKSLKEIALSQFDERHTEPEVIDHSAEEKKELDKFYNLLLKSI